MGLGGGPGAARYRGLLAALLGLAACLGTAGAQGHRLHLSVGPFDDDPGASEVVIVEDRRPQELFRGARLLWEGAFTTDGGYYLGPGIYHDLRIGRRLVVTPSMGMGFYEDGGDKNLGHHLQFRLGIELGVRLGDDWRAGFLYHHLSNSSISDVNPGAESYLFTLSKPFGNRR
jgi:hypothetical protein